MLQVNIIFIQYDPIASSINDYSEQAIEFGYLALFACAFPLAATMTYVADIVEIRFDLWKMLNLQQRPYPTGAQDISIW